MENEKVRRGKNSILGYADQRRLPPSSAFVPNALNISPTAKVPQIGLFCKEGEYWTVALDGNAIRLRDSKGLAYLACLLRHPASDFHVLDLIGGCARGNDRDGLDRPALTQENLRSEGIYIGGLGDAGEVLDSKAKSAYRRRIWELRQDLEEAQALGNDVQGEQKQEEINTLTRELSRAVGLGGRNRRSASGSERARQTITKAIRAAIKRIARHHVVLGDIFSRCIRTGTFCSYRPDPGLPIRWEFAVTNIERRLPGPSAKGPPDYLKPSLRIPLHTALAAHLPNVQADRVQLQHVMLNLILNAVDALSGTSDLVYAAHNQLGN